jgi:small subunit ribosomal protein S21
VALVETSAFPRRHAKKIELSGQSEHFWLAECQAMRDRRRPLSNPTETVLCKSLEVQVGDKGIERAIKHLKRKMAAEGILRELKRRRHYLKPSVKRRKKMSEAARRRRKRLRTGQE